MNREEERYGSGEAIDAIVERGLRILLPLTGALFWLYQLYRGVVRLVGE